MTFFLRPVERSDLDSILAIELQSFSDPWTRDVFLSELHPRGYNFNLAMVEEETGAVAGYCFFWVVSGDEVQISNIAVHPDFRRRGVAQQLVEGALQEGRSRQAVSVSLEVRESNAAARAFYQKIGFEEVGRRPQYYRLPVEDALILRKRIF
ncbi:MAG: ribosomal protein S18-alanine N-acetyltransferase [Candidatus Omnitrophica bacterium]|nr:ribosomal protein S18-alanine N-acetyltransferase [Candidatus Omnitrophota bacterium]